MNVDRLPHRPMEITSPWDLGGDGKHYWKIPTADNRLKRLMRK